MARGGLIALALLLVAGFVAPPWTARAAVTAGSQSGETAGPAAEQPELESDEPESEPERSGPLAPDYGFLDSLKLPWRCGDREPRVVTLDWEGGGHRSLPFSLDFEHPSGGGSIRGSELLAPTSGTVTKATTPIPIYGYWVQIDAGNGWQIFLAHLDGPSPAGPYVSTGDVVGHVGNSGTDHYHIHLEIRWNGGHSHIDHAHSIFGYPRKAFHHKKQKPFTSTNCP